MISETGAAPATGVLPLHHLATFDVADGFTLHEADATTHPAALPMRAHSMVARSVGPQPNDGDGGPDDDGTEVDAIDITGGGSGGGGGGGGGGGNSPGGGGANPGDPPPPTANDTETFGEGDGTGIPTSVYSPGTTVSTVTVNATGFVHAAGVTAGYYSNFNASLGPENEVGEVIVVGRYGDGSMSLSYGGLWLGGSTNDPGKLAVTMTGPDLHHTIHTHPAGEGPSFQDLQTLGDLLRSDPTSWEIIRTTLGDLLVSGPAGLSDFGLTTTSPGVHEGPPGIWQATIGGP